MHLQTYTEDWQREYQGDVLRHTWKTVNGNVSSPMVNAITDDDIDVDEHCKTDCKLTEVLYAENLMTYDSVSNWQQKIRQNQSSSALKPTCFTDPSPQFHFFLPDCLHGLSHRPFLLSYSAFVFPYFLFVVLVQCTRFRWPVNIPYHIGMGIIRMKRFSDAKILSFLGKVGC